MSSVWKTKWGPRRVRREPPNIDEALQAAESITDDFDARVEIAATLLGLPPDAVRQHASKRATLSMKGRPSLVAGKTRAVVVEYKRPRVGLGALGARPLPRR
jgi:hypothetical protein